MRGLGFWSKIFRKGVSAVIEQKDVDLIASERGLIGDELNFFFRERPSVDANIINGSICPPTVHCANCQRVGIVYGSCDGTYIEGI